MKKTSKNYKKVISQRSNNVRGIITEQKRLESIEKEIEKAKLDKMAVLYNGEWSLKTTRDSIYDALMREFDGNIKKVRHCLRTGMEDKVRMSSKHNFAFCGFDNVCFASFFNADISLRHLMKIAQVFGELILSRLSDGILSIPKVFFEDEEALDAEMRRRGIREGFTYDWSEDSKESVRGRKLTEEQRETLSISHLGISTKRKAVSQFDINTFEEIATYSTTAEASRQTNICSSSITACCRLKASTAGGYIWMYSDMNEYSFVA